MSDVQQSNTDLGLGGPAPQSADAVDRVVRLAPTWTVFALIACGLLVAGTAFWAFAGTVTTNVSVAGVFRDRGDQLVKSTAPGVVDEVLVKVGDRVKKGDALITFTNGSDATATAEGRVIMVLVTPGAQVVANKALVSISDPDEPGTIVTMLPPKMVGTVEAGMPVEMAVNSAPSNEFGYMKGYVSQLSSAPVTVQQVAEVLGIDVDLVIAEAGPDPGLFVEISPERDDSTVSGYAWTTGAGPDFAIVTGTGMTVQIIVSESSPIQMVFPQLGASAVGQP